MKLTKGISTDISNLDRQPGYWLTARNAVFSEQYGAVFNEYGFELLLSIQGDDCGAIPLDNNLVALFKRDGANSNIYLVDLKAKTYTLVTSNTVFNLTPNHPLTGEYYRNSKGEIIIAFTDNFNPPRIINTSTSYGSKLDKLTRIYLKFNMAKLNSYTINDTGGSLRTGAYYVSTAYQSVDKATTGYTTAIGPFYITSSVSSDSLDRYVGAEANDSTSKSLTLTYQNVDTDYQYLIVTLVSKIDGVMTAKIVRKIPITGSLMTVDIQGSEDNGVVSLTELLTGIDVYSRVESMTQNNNQLYLANLSKEEDIAYQLSALNIIVNYTQELVDITTVDNSNPKINPLKGHQHDEISALYLHWVRDDGTITRGFHIPGRAVAQYGNGLSEYADFPENTVMNVATGDFIDRAVSIGGANSKIFQFCETADNPNAATNMGYWENNEIYPNSPEYGALQGLPIRHHKFPSISHIKTKYYSADAGYGSYKLSRLGVSISNVSIPAGCVGYYISAAKRSLVQSTILAQDMFLSAGIRQDGTNPPVWTTCGNWNLLSNDDDRDIDMDPNRIRIHAFDLLLDKPNISPTHVQGELCLRNRAISSLYNFDTKTGGSVFTSGLNQSSFRSRALTDDDNCKDIIVSDYTKNNIVVSTMDIRGNISKCDDFRYLPNNVAGIDIYGNLGADETAVLLLNTGNLFDRGDLALHTFNIRDGRVLSPVPQFTGTSGSGDPEEVSYLFNLKQYRINMYEDLSNQSLFILHKDLKIVTDITDVNDIVGGDTIVSDMSFYAYGPIQSQDADTNKGVRVARRYITESIDFSSFRYERDGDASTYFYPYTDAFPLLMDLVRDQQFNKWAYNKDYTSVNDINAIISNDPIANLDFNTLFPERILRSLVQQVEDSGTNNWRTFPVNDYYEMPKVRGPIINIESDGYNIIINQQYALSRTRGKTEIVTSGDRATLGAGDLFEFPPQELLATQEGYAGCQHKFSCLLTKTGYFFVDAEQGKVFLLTNGLKEISADGNYNYFFQAFNNIADNPLLSTGLTVGYDPQYNRILLSRNDNSFTLSYSIDIGNWVSYHDYLPKLMFHNRVGLYSLFNNSIYRHNNEQVKGIFYNNTIYPTYIIPTFNEPSTVVKYTFNIRWKSEIHKLDGSNQREETLTHIFIWNSYQATNEVRLIPTKNLLYNTYNTRKSAGIWRYNKFRDLVINNLQNFVLNDKPIQSNIDINKPFQDKRRFIDHWLNVKFIYDNQPIDGQQRNMYLYEVDVEIKPVER